MSYQIPSLGSAMECLATVTDIFRDPNEYEHVHGEPIVAEFPYDGGDKKHYEEIVNLFPSTKDSVRVREVLLYKTQTFHRGDSATSAHLSLLPYRLFMETEYALEFYIKYRDVSKVGAFLAAHCGWHRSPENESEWEWETGYHQSFFNNMKLPVGSGSITPAILRRYLLAAGAEPNKVVYNDHSSLEDTYIIDDLKAGIHAKFTAYQDDLIANKVISYPASKPSTNEQVPQIVRAFDTQYRTVYNFMLQEKLT